MPARERGVRENQIVLLISSQQVAPPVFQGKHARYPVSSHLHQYRRLRQRAQKRGGNEARNLRGQLCTRGMGKTVGRGTRGAMGRRETGAYVKTKLHNAKA